MSEGVKEVLITLPKNLLNEVNGLMNHEFQSLDDFMYNAAKNYLKYKKSTDNQQFYECMQRGYTEMAGINLNLCSEAFQAEEEAEKNNLEHSVIGV